MNKREWLIARGLAKPGRGRLSRQAHEALEEAIADGVVFTDTKETTYELPPIEPYKKIRSITRPLIGYTREGWEVGFDTCNRCSLYVNYCECKEGIKVPSIVVSLDKYTEKAVKYPYENTRR